MYRRASSSGAGGKLLPWNKVPLSGSVSQSELKSRRLATPGFESDSYGGPSGTTFEHQ
jgi:hypothetical protein